MTVHRVPSGTIRRASAAALVLVTAGCAQTIEAPPPAAYEGAVPPLSELAPELRSVDAEILYATDRRPEVDGYGEDGYGIARSTSVAFGTATVRLEAGEGWDDLVAWTESREGAPTGTLGAELVGFEERGRLPATPYLFELDAGGKRVVVPEIAEEVRAANEQARALIRERLARTPRKAVDLYVHGIRTEFEPFVVDVAVDWHLSGRLGVPIAYTWPAGGGGLLSAYAYDRESGEFTIPHLKQVLVALAELDEVEEVNIYAHSRGTDVVTTAIRELFLEARGAGLDPREVYKIANLVLLAPDLDLEVSIQRMGDNGVGSDIGRITIYTSAGDSAIGAAQALFSSRARLGKLSPEALTPRQRELAERATNLDFVIYTGSRGGGFGHSYYRAPAIRADALLLVRDGRAPGAENGRPLEHAGGRFWKIDDDYLR